MAAGGPTGIVRLIKACGYSMRGLQAAFIHESAFRQELALAVILLPLGVWLGKTPFEQALLASVVLLVLIVELLNSAIEAVVDRVGPEQHELAGRAKDIGSAAVFVSLLMALMVWCLVLLPPVL